MSLVSGRGVYLEKTQYISSSNAVHNTVVNIPSSVSVGFIP